MFIVYANSTAAQTRAQALTEARLQEEWGDAYDGQTVWPDGITVRAVEPFDHPENGRAAFPTDPRHDKHYTSEERGGKRDRPWMVDEGFLPEPPTGEFNR